MSLGLLLPLHTLSPECEDEWDVILGMGTLGGDFQVVDIQKDCLDLCLSDPDCVAVDVSTQAPFFCFVHSNQSLLDNESYNNTLILQQRLTKRCADGMYCLMNKY